MTRTLADITEPHAATHLSTRVAISRLPRAAYPATTDDNEITQALRRAARELGWTGTGAASGAFDLVIPRGARVAVKPNLVLHENQNRHGGLLPLVTHPSVIRSVVAEVLKTEAAQVLVGDAPVQGCDFDALLELTGLGAWRDDLTTREPRFLGVRDFRRTVSRFVGGVRVAEENRQPTDRFVLFDLGGDSLLEPVTDASESFRVTCYDPRLLARTHAPGRHQYLVAREVLEADVVINLPKLKTHKKAGVTCALKNLVGINGNKEYLPHHRVGGARQGGDCYAGASTIKRTLEFINDRQNTARTFAGARVWSGLSRPLFRALKAMGESLDLEGSWSGNDTVWRMCLDLNRILLYGRADGTLADVPQRRILHVVDAVVAGQADGPLAPRPLEMGLLLAGANAAATDSVGAHLLGYDPARIPVVREAFGNFRWSLAPFAREDVQVVGALGAGAADELLPSRADAPQVIYPAGWRDAAVRPAAIETTANAPDETSFEMLSGNHY